jgi:tetratricopeptide (TPR) repeat protein
MLDRKISVFIAVLSVLFGEYAYAASAETWAAGQSAFVDGDYVAALRSFESARKSGLDTPAVHYNIAVCNFKLDDFVSAGDEFRLIANKYPQMRGLAEYNLGLVARRLGDEPKARQHFLIAYQASPDNETVRILASKMLRETETSDSTALRWTGSAGLRVGHDDNVALRDEIALPAGAATASPMADIFGSVRSPWNGRQGLRLDGSAYLVRYSDAEEFNQSDIQARLYYQIRLDDWQIDLGGHASAGTLGGDAFDRKTGGSAQAIWFVGQKSTLNFRYVHDDISNTDPAFAGIRGSRQQVGARYKLYSGEHKFILRYWSEINDRIDPAVSPTRTRVAAEYRFAPESGWGYETGISIRNSDYDDLATPRKEELLTVRAGLTHLLFSNWFVLLDYRYSENDSSDPLFSYDRNQISLGVLTTF